MKNIYLYKYLFFLLPLFTVSCEDIIDVELNSVPPKIVIEGNVALDSLATVKVSTTHDFSATGEYPIITSAVVKVWDNAGNSETLLPNSKGLYVTSGIRGVEGRTYNLSVNYDDKEYTATSTMPPLVAIDSLTLFDFPVLDYRTPMVHFTTPPGNINDYYKFYVYVNGERRANKYETYSTDLLDDGMEMHIRLSVPRDPATNDDPVEKGDTLTVEMQCIDKDMHDYWDTLMMIENSLANPTTNIKGGALGYFGAYSYSQMSIVAVW